MLMNISSNGTMDRALTNLIYYYMIQISSGITRGRALNGELYEQRLLKLINLFAFAYRLFHEDFSPVY